MSAHSKYSTAGQSTMMTVGLGGLLAALILGGIALATWRQAPTPATAPAAVELAAPAEVAVPPAMSRHFADELAGASAPADLTAARSGELPEGLRDLQASGAASAPAEVAVPPAMSRHFADELAGSGGAIVDPRLLTDPGLRLQRGPQ